MKPAVQISCKKFKYSFSDEYILQNLEMQINFGEVTLLSGLSGCGKSTLLSLINGIIPRVIPGEFEGKIFIDGEDSSSKTMSQISRKVGSVLQNAESQIIHSIVEDEIAFGCENFGFDPSVIHDEIENSCRLMQINKNWKTRSLSGGQKQRLVTASTLAMKSDILIFDEPLANLDPATGKSAIELIDKIQKESNTTVIIIEHRIEDVLWEKVDRIILLDDGCIISDSTPQQLLTGPLLVEYGIREPLYLTALKYTGVDVSKVEGIDNIKTVRLTENDKTAVRRWFSMQPKPVLINDNDVILETRNLDFGYTENTQILFDVSLKIQKGEMLAIVGRNGAGKSTLCKLVCGFENPQSGRIFYANKDITDSSIRQRAAHIGYVMQNPNQMISQSMIFDEVAMGIKKSGLTEEQIKERVYETLKICGLYEFRNWPISALSFGQKKRVTIASILVMGPDIIILDEPTAGQDFRHYTEIMEFLNKLHDQGITVIIVTHDMHLMLEYTNRALVFLDGRLMRDDSGSSVLCNPELINRAALKETSLFAIANMCGIDDPVAFVDCFIAYEKKERSHAE